jgi:hypothetical protein
MISDAASGPCSVPSVVTEFRVGGREFMISDAASGPCSVPSVVTEFRVGGREFMVSDAASGPCSVPSVGERECACARARGMTLYIRHEQ